MSSPHLVLGLALIAIGAFTVAKRKSLPFRADPDAAVLPPAGYGVLGALLFATGLLQLAQAFD